MAGYWPSSFFACLWPEKESRSIKRTRPISSHLDRASLINKGFIIWLSAKFSCVTQRVANHSAGFDSSCLLTELVI